MTTARRLLPCLALILGATAAGAMPLAFPSTAMRAGAEAEAMGSADLPLGGYRAGGIQTLRAEGAIRREAWQMSHGGQSTLQILAPLRAQLAAAGYEVLFECATQACGGFDFRYALSVLPEPDMHVDLGDFRFLTARRVAQGAPDYVTLLVSRSTERGFVQVTTVGAPLPMAPAVATKSPDPGAAILPQIVDSAKAGAAVALPVPDTPLPARLEASGRAVLADLSFGTGSSKLEEGSGSSLSALADYLIDHPDRAIVLVGHTDAEGALDNNIALSRQRAEAVRAHLVQGLGVPAQQVRAEGVGYLAPLTSNETEAGRSANRRVEVILK